MNVCPEFFYVCVVLRRKRTSDGLTPYPLSKEYYLFNTSFLVSELFLNRSRPQSIRP
jgi:hypothetical protein